MTHRCTETVIRRLHRHYPDILIAAAMFSVSVGLIIAVLTENPVHALKGVALMFACASLGMGVMMVLRVFGVDE
jgi:1,4-dihydroxy-2-naphthoate octaprenyltransferase